MLERCSREVGGRRVPGEGSPGGFRELTTLVINMTNRKFLIITMDTFFSKKSPSPWICSKPATDWLKPQSASLHKIMDRKDGTDRAARCRLKPDLPPPTRTVFLWIDS